MDYFSKEATEDSISGDDVNRRLREARLGHSAPTADWAECKRICRCLWPAQKVTAIHLDGFYHFAPDFEGFIPTV